MLRRIERVVRDLREHAVAARELSVGALEAFATLTRGRSELEATFARHDANVRRELPGF
jgi:hypothetical protein